MRIFAHSTLSVVTVPRRFRFRLWLIREAKWLVPAERCFTFPLAVSRKRFFVPLWVFILGMFGYHASYVVSWAAIHKPVIVTDLPDEKRGIESEKPALLVITARTSLDYSWPGDSCRSVRHTNPTR